MLRTGLASIAGGVAMAALLAALNPASACACCSDRGQRNVGSAELADYQWSEIDRIRFGGTAELYTGSADTSDIQGIANADSSYTLAVTRDGKAVTFAFTGQAGQTGSLAMTLPVNAAFYEIDTRDVPDSGVGPAIYKEWKFSAEPTGTGDFAAGTGKGQTLTLILQGRGNNCAMAEDFTHWTLVMEGPKGAYMLFGDLAQAE